MKVWIKSLASKTQVKNVLDIVIGFDACGNFLFLSGNGFGKGVKIFGVDNSCSTYVDNRKKRYLSSG